MFQLDIEQQFNASTEQLFKAFTDPNFMQHWYAPGSMTVPEVTSDAMVGGNYRIVMQNDDGSQHIVGGEYKEFTPHSLLIFTWQWEDSPNVTLVKVSFKATADNSTLLKLNHSEFIEEEYRDKHQEGWIGCLANLPKAL